MSARNLPEVVSRDEWLAARRELLIKEKELTRHNDQLSAARRRLPMVRIDKPYTFEGPGGTVSLIDLFEDRPQLVMHHFMGSSAGYYRPVPLPDRAASRTRRWGSRNTRARTLHRGRIGGGRG
jgi:predicted dithiol-disulfide oxidoreductase (DUF899 family)